MKLSIIIVNYRGWKRLRLCLESLRSLKGASFSWEIIVVDNRSEGDQLKVFTDDFPEFYFVENTGNNGFSNGCNFGAKRSSGEYLLFLNPDTIVKAGSIQRLLGIAEAHPEFTILSCDQVTDSGKDDKPSGMFLRPATLTSFLRSLYKLTHQPPAATTPEPGTEVIFPDWVSGSVMLIQHNRYNVLGWDEDFWMYYEDMDICKRAREQGGQVALVRNIQIIHNHGGASRINRQVKALTKSEVIISRHLYIHKHFRGLQRFFMQSYLVINNLLFGQLIFAVLGLLFFFKPSMTIYPVLYVKIVRYYASALANKTWMSQRSVNYKRTTTNTYETAKAEAV